MKHYDKAERFFFFDPPYLNANVGAYDGWTEEQMQELREVLDGMKAAWLLTVDDSPPTRRIFAGFRIEATELRNTLATNHGKSAAMRELFIRPAVK